jgi:toxin ParE1/3/4
MTSFVLTREARADLIAIWQHIAPDNPDAADKVISQIEEALSRLSDMPGMGHFNEGLLNRQFKFWSVYSYVIAYRWTAMPIEIIAIVHGARDLDAFFGGRRPAQ